MKLFTFWLVCCVGFLYSGGGVDGYRRTSSHQRGPQRRASTSLNQQLKTTGPAITHTDENLENWFIQTFSRSLVHFYLIIPPNLIPTKCPQWMHGVYRCFTLYYHPETTTNKVDMPPATTGLNDKIATTTQAPEVVDITGEEVSVANRFGLKVDFNNYYNTKTGVDLKIVKPLRKPSIKIPPADHSIGATDISSKKRPSPPTTEGNESDDDFNFPDSSVNLSVNTATRRPPTTRNLTHRSTPRSTVTKVKNSPTTAPLNNDEDTISFEGNESTTRKPRSPELNTSTAARKKLTTKFPLIPCTNGKTELTRNNQKDQEDPIPFNNEELNTKGTTSVFYEKRELPDLNRAIQECCKRTSILGCFESKGFNLDKNPCEPILRRGWDRNL